MTRTTENIGFIIDKDHLYVGEPGDPDRTGMTRFLQRHPDGSYEDAEFTTYFRLYDDDGELYYEGRATDEIAAEYAYRWAMGDSGVTRIDTRQGDKWSTLIG